MFYLNIYIILYVLWIFLFFKIKFWVWIDIEYLHEIILWCPLIWAWSWQTAVVWMIERTRTLLIYSASKSLGTYSVNSVADCYSMMASDWDMWQSDLYMQQIRELLKGSLEKQSKSNFYKNWTKGNFLNKSPR